MPAMVIGILSSIGFLAKRAPSTTSVSHRLAIAFERIARDRRAEEQQIVEMRQLALGAAAANVVDAGRRRAADLGQRIRIEGRGFARRGSADVRRGIAHQ